MLARLAKNQERPAHKPRRRSVPKLTGVVDGRRQIKDNPPFLFHVQENLRRFQRENRHHLEQYPEIVAGRSTSVFERFHFQDTAVKVVGVGSVGTRCYLRTVFRRRR